MPAAHLSSGSRFSCSLSSIKRSFPVTRSDYDGVPYQRQRLIRWKIAQFCDFNILSLGNVV